MNRIYVQPLFTATDISCLTQSWNILKNHDIIKFADEVLIKGMHRSSNLRQFWTSRMVIDSNNYDYSQGESCLRTDLSWLIGLREHSIHFTMTFDKLISSINDEKLLLIQIQSLQLLQNISTLEYDSLIILKQCIIETIRERFQMFKYNFVIDYDQAWNKFLSFIIKYLLEKKDKIRGPTKIIISPATNIDQTSSNK
ncbi:unnamed protein product [Adineta steineri]|nr:unnamed protein product [Adineta steineri]CAF1176603.1 unnamed protein product [Adineta steineri]CAF3582636.1 unnamed protein product [Adineta steineri]CAF3736578.1 unnamed protein product [Adineta steineri]